MNKLNNYDFENYDFILRRNGKRYNVQGKFKEECIKALNEKKVVRARTWFDIEDRKYQILSANHKHGHKCIVFLGGKAK